MKKNQTTKNVLQTDPRTRIVESLGNMVGVSTVSRSEEKERPKGEVCDYEGFGKVLATEAAMRGLTCEHIGEHIGNWLIQMPEEDCDKQTIFIAVHADVVPVGERKDWNTDPFQLTLRGENAYGRGAADCKSGIVVGLETMAELLTQRNSKVNLRMLVGRDEETGSKLGFAYLANAGLLKADAALVWDTRPVITVASSGVIPAKVHFLGKATHALGLFDAIRQYAQEREKVTSVFLATEAPRPNLWGRVTPTIIRFSASSGRETARDPISVVGIHAGEKTNTVPKSCVVTCRLTSIGEWGKFIKIIREQLASGFEAKDNECRVIHHAHEVSSDVREPEKVICYEGKLEIVGVGGHAGYPHQTRNSIPEAIRLVRGYIQPNASFEFFLGVDARVLPEEDVLKIKSELSQAFTKGAGAGVADLKLDDEQWAIHSSCMLEKTPANDSLVSQVQKAFESQGLDTRIYGGLGALDLDMLIRVGIPSLAAGPQNASIHGPNEYVSLSQIEKFIALTVELAQNWKNLPNKTTPE